MSLDLKPIEGGPIALGGIDKRNITGIDKIDIPSLASIDNALYVEGYNLLSISQFSDSGYIIPFYKDQCLVKIEYDKSLFTTRKHNNMYEIDLISLRKQNVTCVKSNNIYVLKMNHPNYFD